MLFLCALLMLPQDPAARARELIEQLRSDRIEDRQSAARELEALAETARADLEKALNDPSPEVREPAARLLRDMGRRLRTRVIRPHPLNLSFELTQVPFLEARRRLLTPFGADPEILPWPADFEPGGRQISLRLADGTLWGALDALAAALGAPLEPLEGRVRLLGPGEGKPGWSPSDTPEARIWGRVERQKNNRGEVSLFLDLEAHLLPGAGPLAWRLAALDVQADGQPCVLDRLVLLDGGWRTPKAGILSTLPLPMRRITPPEGALPATLDAQGMLVLQYPWDLEIQRLDFVYLTDPVEHALGPASLRLDHVRRDEGPSQSVQFAIAPRAGAPPQRFLVSLEGADGARVWDLGLYDTEKAATLQMNSTTDRRPVRWVFQRVAGTEEILIPFRFKGLPVPP